MKETICEVTVPESFSELVKCPNSWLQKGHWIPSRTHTKKFTFRRITGKLRTLLSGEGLCSTESDI